MTPLAEHTDKGRIFDGLMVAQEMGARIRASKAGPEQSAPRRALHDTPSPIQRLERLERDLDASVKLYVKRDDCLRPLFGNKLRYIEYVVGAYDALDADAIVHCGGLQSNYLAQLAIAGAELGIPMHLIVNAQRPPGLQGNPLLAEIFGADIRYRQGSGSALKAQFAAELAQAGARPLVIDAPFTNHSAILGYLRAWREITSQVKAGEMDMPDHIVMCSAGNSYLGLRIGADMDGAEVGITAVTPIRFADTGLQSVAPDRNSFLRKKVSEFGQFIGRELPTVKFDFDETFVGPCYGLPSKAGISAIRYLARTEGLLLDPVYNGKAMAALLSHIGAGRFGKGARILFIHSGGLPNVYTCHDAFTN